MAVPRPVKILLLVAAVALAAVLGVAVFFSVKPPLVVRDPDRVDQLKGRVQEFVHKNILAADDRVRPREDGFVYTVDFGQLMAFAARAGDRQLYDQVHALVTEYLLVNDPKTDTYTVGMVRWRTGPERGKDADSDCSGTTEMLRVSQALWLGAKAFNRPDDQKLALLILDAYNRHAYVDKGIWLIRNYYNLRTKSFATNSFLVDYDPDFIAEAAAETARPDLSELAEKSYETVENAVAASGLIYDVCQPEMSTLYPNYKNIAYYSPRDLVQIYNSATVAERVMKGRPKIAQRVLDFARQRSGDLNLYYYATSGAKADTDIVRLEAYSVLVRLAIGLEDQKALDAFLPLMLNQVQKFLDYPTANPLHIASEALLALQAVSEYNHRHPAQTRPSP